MQLIRSLLEGVVQHKFRQFLVGLASMLPNGKFMHVPAPKGDVKLGDTYTWQDAKDPDTKIEVFEPEQLAGNPGIYHVKINLTYRLGNSSPLSLEVSIEDFLHGARNNIGWLSSSLPFNADNVRGRTFLFGFNDKRK